MLTILRVAGLAWGDAVIEAAFFIMQTYLTQVWKLNFTTAAAFLNIWGGIYRILPLFFLFLADTLLGNFKMLAVSGITTTMGLVLITLISTRGSCKEKDASCVGHAEKVLFLIGMVLVALGKATRVASSEAFIMDQNGNHGSNPQKGWLVISAIVFFVTPLAGIFAFPYVKKWYVLFGASAICTASATIFFLSGYSTYKRPGAKAEGSPLTDIVRVFVAATFKRSQPFPKDDDEGKLYVTDEQFRKLSPSLILGFLHKAAIIVDDDRNAGSGEVKKRSWKVCSVTEVETAKMVIRLIPVWSCLLMCGVVSSIGNTYFVEQMSHMKSNMGSWKAPPQIVLLIFVIFKYFVCLWTAGQKIDLKMDGSLDGGGMAVLLSVVCCAVAGAVERRRIHVVRRHHLLDDQAETPMSAFWMLAPYTFLMFVDIMVEVALTAYHDAAPKPMQSYSDCFSEGVIGLGYMCGALSVYVVGKFSKMRGGKGWFQDALNASRLDRYYWVLTTLTALIFILFTYLIEHFKYMEEAVDVDWEADKDFKQETALQAFGIKKSSALGLILRYFPKADKFLDRVVRWLVDKVVDPRENGESDNGKDSAITIVEEEETSEV